MTGAPSVRRLKTYSSQPGYVYQYSYEGQRPYHAGANRDNDTGTEFVFRLSADRKNWCSVHVLVAGTAIRAWEQAHERTLSSTEHYAIAKVALFQAFDERATPALMKQDVKVRPADVEAILETLGIAPSD